MRSSLTFRRAIQGIQIICWMMVIPALSQVADKSESQFPISIDYARFQYSDSLTYFELYAAVPRRLLTYQPEQGRYKAEFKATAEVFLQDSLVAVKVWKNVNHVDSLSAIEAQQSLFCFNHFLLPVGDFEMSLQIEDLNNSAAKSSYRFPVQITSFNNPELQLSDLQISSSIVRDTTASPFLKNGFHVLPNPSGVYGLGLPILYLYSEIYHLASASTDSGARYGVVYRIYDAEGKVAKEVPVRLRTKPGDSAVEITGINVVTLASGVYRVVEEVTDMENGARVQGVRKFFVYREGDYAEGGAALAKPEAAKGSGSAGMDFERYGVISEKEIDQEFEWARYISSKEERNVFKKLNLEGKRTYIQEFWAKRDPSPGTPENEFKHDYLNRIQQANQSFRGTFRDGWRTDRGRILLVYGPPDEVMRYPFSNDNRAYEIWHYYAVQGGVEFYFVDKRDTGDMELVHSTARGELYDEDWEHWKNPTQ